MSDTWDADLSQRGCLGKVQSGLVLCPQGLEWCLAPTKHRGVVSAATERGGSLRDSFMLTLYLEGVE